MGCGIVQGSQPPIEKKREWERDEEKEKKTAAFPTTRYLFEHKERDSLLICLQLVLI